MKIATAIVISVFSIVVFSHTVKARAADLPKVSKSDLKDSVRDTAKKDMAELVDFMTANGRDAEIGEGLAEVIGLPGPRSVKSKGVSESTKGKARNALNCFVVYEDAPAESQVKKPICVYLMRVTEDAQIKDSQFFRISLDGKLEKVVTNRGKRDEKGKMIEGSGVATDHDMTSSEVQKTYAAGIREVKAWLKTQKKLAAKKGAAAKTSPKQ